MNLRFDNKVPQEFIAKWHSDYSLEQSYFFLLLAFCVLLLFALELFIQYICIFVELIQRI